MVQSNSTWPIMAILHFQADCGAIVSFDTSNISQTIHKEINVRLVQADES